MKYSLSPKEAQGVLKNAKHFKTKNISFKYISSCRSAIAFSVGKKAGSAVLRNRFKRQARSIFLSQLFKETPLFLLVHSRVKIEKLNSLLEDFSLFKGHLKENWIPAKSK